MLGVGVFEDLSGEASRDWDGSGRVRQASIMGACRREESRMLKSALLATVLGVGCLAMASVTSAQYIHVCSNATIAGQYGFQDSGTRDVNGKTVQYDSVRTAQFSGEGKHQGKGYFSVGGTIRMYTTTGKFAVAGDCTFTMDATTTYTDGTAPTSYKQFGVVVRGGKEILTIQMHEGRNQTGKYQRMIAY
jgi:hypothetical protein